MNRLISSVPRARVLGGVAALVLTGLAGLATPAAADPPEGCNAISDESYACADTTSTAPGVPVLIDLLANDSPGVWVSRLETGGGGVPSLTDEDGVVLFTPAEGFTGRAFFYYYIEDGSGDDVWSIVWIDVEGSTAPSALGSTSLPALTVGVPVETQLEADGSPAPTFAVTAGTLPAGLTLNAETGEITGTPTAAGAYAFTITATNTAGSVSGAFSGSVTPAPTAPTAVSAPSWPALTAGAAVQTQLVADGSPAPTFAVTGGALPAGLVLDAATGAITGTPTAAGAYAFTITATNGTGASSASFSGSVAVPDSTALPPAAGTLSVSVRALTPGASTELVAEGYRPGSSVTFAIYSEPLVLGTVLAGADGVARLTVTLPAGLAAGTHTVVSLGEDAAGVLRVLSQAVTVSLPADPGTGLGQAAGSGTATLPVTGGGSASAIAVVAALMAAGTGLLSARRRLTA